MNIKFKKYWRKTSFKKKEDGDFLLKHIQNIKKMILQLVKVQM